MLDNKTFTEENFKESQIVFGHDEKILKAFNCDLDTSMNLGISSLPPKDIKTRVQYFKQNYGIKNFLLSNTDVYTGEQSNHRLEFDQLMEYLSNLDAFFIIQTLGIKDKKIADNIYEISYPYMFNLKHSDIIKTENREYGFSFLNNYPRYFRLELGFYLWNANLLDEIFYTQSLHGQKPIIKNTFIPEDKFNEFVQILPRQYEKGKNMEHDHTLNNPAFSNAYAHIYTESEIEMPVVTEKTFKPFMSGQIPIPLACKGHLRYLKNLGFHTFDDLLGQEFDFLDPYYKMLKIKEIVKKGKGFIKDYYLSNLDKIEHNNKNLILMQDRKLSNLINKFIN